MNRKIVHKILRNNWLSNTAINVFNAYKKIQLKFVNFKYTEAENPSISEQTLLAYNKNRTFKVHKNLCFAPKKSMLFSFDGNVYLCCENKQYTLGNVNNKSLKDIWFSEARTTINHQINNNYNLENGCNTCKQKMVAGNYSLALAQTFDIYANSKNDFPERLDFEIYNTCNLECVMCGGIYSSSIQANRIGLPNYKLQYNDRFIDELRAFIPYIKYINLIGGEPTLIKIYYDIIELVIELNPKCVIHLQTNASSLNSKFKSYLKRANFQIGLSIDALSKDRLEFIRKNIVYEKFIIIVDNYIQLKKENKTNLTVNMCPMPINWQEIIPVIEFCNKHKLSLFFCIVNAPHYYSFASVDCSFIDTVIEHLEKSQESLPKNNYYENANYTKLIEFINYLKETKKSNLIRENKTASLKHNSVNNLYDLYEQRLIELLLHDEKVNIVKELLEYIKIKFNNLEVANQKEFLIVLITNLDKPIVPVSKAEQLKWGKEYINTLIFSYQNTFVNAH